MEKSKDLGSLFHRLARAVVAFRELLLRLCIAASAKPISPAPLPHMFQALDRTIDPHVLRLKKP